MFLKLIFLFFIYLVFLTGISSRDLYALEKKFRHQIQIKITYQDSDYRTPWRTKNPGVRFATGTYLGENRVLLPAYLLSNYTLIEGRSPEETSSISGLIRRIDHESDLAVLEFPNSGRLFNEFTPIDFPNTIVSRSSAEVFRIDPTGETIQGSCRMGNLLVGTYPEGRVELPYVEFSSSEKLAGNGEMIRSKDGTIAGIVNEFSIQTGRGRLIPSEIIYRFLTSNSSFASKGFQFRPITDLATTSYYGIPEGRSGVIVTDIFLGGSADGILQIEDVILEVSGFPLDGKGRILHPKYGKVSFAYLLNDPHITKSSINDKMPLLVLRKGKILNLNLILKPFPEEVIFIPHGRDTSERPGYLVVAGLVFTELTEFYLKEFGREWRSNVDKKMLYLLDYHKYREKSDSPNRAVYLIQVLPDEGNNGYQDIRGKRVLTLNGDPIKDLKDLYKRTKNLLESPNKNSDWILVLEDGTLICFSKERILSMQKKILETYGIPNFYSSQE